MNSLSTTRLKWTLEEIKQHSRCLFNTGILLCAEKCSRDTAKHKQETNLIYQSSLRNLQPLLFLCFNNSTFNQQSIPLFSQTSSKIPWQSNIKKYKKKTTYLHYTTLKSNNWSFIRCVRACPSCLCVRGWDKNELRKYLFATYLDQIKSYSI